MNYAQIVDWQIPARIAGGLARYTLGNIQTGSGLRAILEGDLFETVARCDPEVVANLGNIVRVVNNYIPSGAWGSPKRVDAWIRNKGNWTEELISDRHHKIWAGLTDA